MTTTNKTDSVGIGVGMGMSTTMRRHVQGGERQMSK